MPNSGRSGAGGGEADPVTLGEVARNLERLAEQMERGFERVDERFNTLAMVHADVYLADRATDSERYRALKATLDALTIEKLPARLGTLEQTVNGITGTTRMVKQAVIGTIVTLVLAGVWALAAVGHS